MSSNRTYYLDVIRIIAIIFVILLHSPLPQNNSDSSSLLSSISYLTSPCIGLFFMVSGALLLPSMEGTFFFLKKRASKLIPPTLCWTIIYLMFDYIYHEYEFSIHSVAYRLLSSIFSPQGHGIMWYMYALMGFYLIIPIISPWLKKASVNELTFCILLTLVAYSIPYLSMILEVGVGPQSNLFYFSGFGGYFILGYYLHNHPNIIRFRYTSIGMIIAVLIPVIIKLMHFDVDYYSLFWYLSLPVALMCIFWFKLIQRCSIFFDKLPSNFKNLIATTSSYCFGIYLCHIMFMKYIVKKLDIIQQLQSSFLQTILIFVFTLLLSTVFVIIISKTKFGKYLFATK